MDKDLKKTLERHYELWMEVARLCSEDMEGLDYSDAGDVKFAALGNLGYKDQIRFDCWCCEFTGYNQDDAKARDWSKCRKCPVDWGVDLDNLNDPPCCMGLFQDFIDSFDCGMYNQAEEIAKEIANLPINPIYEEEE